MNFQKQMFFLIIFMLIFQFGLFSQGNYILNDSILLKDSTPHIVEKQILYNFGSNNGRHLYTYPVL